MDPRMSVWTRPRAAWPALALVAAACGDEPIPTDPDYYASRASATEATGVVIELQDNVPNPGVVYIQAGELVTWKNVGTNPHTVSTYGIITPTGMLDDAVWKDTELAPGESFMHVFERPAEYSYICAIHGEIGSVVVTEATMDGDMDDYMSDMDMDDMMGDMMGDMDDYMGDM